MGGLTGRHERRLRWRRCEALLRDVTVPDPFDLDTFCRLLGDQRGRPLHVLPLPGQAGAADVGSIPCGAWIATAAFDAIFVEPGVAPLHHEHIVLHEIGHVLSDHRPDTPVETALVERLMPALDPALVQRVLGRTSYLTPAEQDAETIATIIGSRVFRRVAPSAAAAAEPDDALLDHIARVFGGSTGRDR